MRYYVSITVKSSRTKLGGLLTTAVVERYMGALLTAEQAKTIPLWLKETIAELCGKNKRLKPMVVKVNGRFNGRSVAIHAVTENGTKAFEDNRPFTIYLSPVRKDHTSNPAILREYDHVEIIDATIDSLKGSICAIFTTLGIVDTPEGKEKLKATAEAIESAIVEIGKLAKHKEGGNNEK